VTFLIILVGFWALITGILWIKYDSILWWEWLAGVGAGILTVVLLVTLGKMGQAADTELWSGTVSSATHIPKWVSEEERAVYKQVSHTDSKGNTYYTREFSHYETYYDTHSPRWSVSTTLGQWGISQSEYADLKVKFGGERTDRGHRPNYYSGDRNDYNLVNTHRWVEPVTRTASFENRIKAAPSTFSFPPVPEDARVFDWPASEGLGRSNRLLGRAKLVDILEWDRMCARLGPRKKVNMIMIGFGPNSSQSDAVLQESAWIGGRKNDLVLCFGNDEGGRAGWSYVFGWTEEGIVKRNLETILLQRAIDDTIIPAIEAEVMANYKIRDWSEFDHITIPVPVWVYPVTIIVLMLTQGLLFWFFHSNEFTKDNPVGTIRPRFRGTIR